MALTRGAYALAFSTVEGMNTLRTDRHLLRRIYVGPGQSLREFAANVRRGRRNHQFDQLRVKLGVRTRLRKLFGVSE